MCGSWSSTCLPAPRLRDSAGVSIRGPSAQEPLAPFVLPLKRVRSALPDTWPFLMGRTCVTVASTGTHLGSSSKSPVPASAAVVSWAALCFLASFTLSGPKASVSCGTRSLLCGPSLIVLSSNCNAVFCG